MRLASAFIVLACSSPALALGPGEASLSAGVGPALHIADSTQVGLHLGARLMRGISDAWAGRLGVQTSWSPAIGNVPSLHVTTQSIGMTWALDALNVVPFADVGLLAADVRGGQSGASWHLGAEVGGGVEYWASRHLVASLVAHLDYLPLRVLGAHRERPLQATVMVLAGRAF